jgi:hypothetical protein
VHPTLSDPSISLMTFKDFPGKDFLDLTMSENRIDNPRSWIDMTSCHPQFT